MSYRELVSALGQAIELIAELQRKGCPAGPVAVPSRIRDAYFAGRDAVEPDSTGRDAERERRIGAADGLVWALTGQDTL